MSWSQLVCELDGPSLMSSSVESAQISLLSSVLNENSLNVCLALMPIHCYKGSKLFELEHALCKACNVVGNMYVDRPFHLMYKTRADSRDARPMMYLGRVMTLDGYELDGCWEKSTLIAEGRTEPIEMMKAGDMDVVDHVDDVALPKNHSRR